MNRALIVVAALLVMAGCGAASSGASVPATQPLPSATSTAGTTSTTRAVSLPTTPQVTTPATTAAAATGSVTNPVPFGSVGSVTGWKVKVISVAAEGTDTLTSQPPPAGYQFVVYTIQATRTGSDPEAAFELDPVLLANQVERGVDTSPTCYGGSPDNDQVMTGGTVSTSDCISVPSGAGLLLGVSGDGFTDSRTWFAIR